MTAVHTEQANLSEGSVLIYKDYGTHIRMAHDPVKISEDHALHILRSRIPRLAHGVLHVHRAAV